MVSKGCSQKVYHVGAEGEFQEFYLLVSKGCSKRSTCWYRRGVPKGLPVGFEGVFPNVYIEGVLSNNWHRMGVPKGLPVGIEGVFPKGLPVGARRGVPKGLPVGIKWVFQKVYLLVPKGCSKRSTCWYKRGVPKGLPDDIEGLF